MRNDTVEVCGKVLDRERNEQMPRYYEVGGNDRKQTKRTVFKNLKTNLSFVKVLTCHTG